jgi:hypothetical protein
LRIAVCERYFERDIDYWRDSGASRLIAINWYLNSKCLVYYLWIYSSLSGINCNSQITIDCEYCRAWIYSWSSVYAYSYNSISQICETSFNLWERYRLWQRSDQTEVRALLRDCLKRGCLLNRILQKLVLYPNLRVRIVITRMSTTSFVLTHQNSSTSPTISLVYSY